MSHTGQCAEYEFAKILGDACRDVENRSNLQLLENEMWKENLAVTEDEARLDVKSNELMDSHM